MTIELRKLTLEDLDLNMLQHFNRYQEVSHDWTKQGDEYVLLSNPHVEDWNEQRKLQKVEDSFRSILENNGGLFGAYDGDKLIGFAGYDFRFFGSENQYVELTQLHVSYEYRGQRIGRELFDLCVTETRERGCQKLYIVASSSKESQEFYRNIGCVYAEEINLRLFEEDPLDIHMEYVL